MNIVLSWLLFSVFLFTQQELPGSWLGRFKLAEEAFEADSCDEAIKYLKSCLNLIPNNSTSAYHLACAYARMGHLDESLFWLKKSIDWGWADAAVIHWDKDLEPLRRKGNFKNLKALAEETQEVSNQSLRLTEVFPNVDSWTSISISPDGDRIVERGNLWDVRTGELLAMLYEGTDYDDQSFFDPWGEYIVTIRGCGSDVCIWNGKNGRLIKSLTDIHSPGIIGFGEEGLIHFNTKFTWEEKSDHQMKRLNRITVPLGKQRSGEYQGEYYDICGNQSSFSKWQKWAISPGGKRVLTCPFGDQKVYLWDGDTGELISSYSIFDTRKVGFSNDSSQAYIQGSTEDGSMNNNRIGVKWINAEDGSILRNLELEEDLYIEDCALINERELVTVCTNGNIRWWKVDEGAPVREMQVSRPANIDVYDRRFLMKICGGGERLAIYSPAFPIPFRLLDLSTGLTLREWPGYEYRVSFSRDHCFLARHARLGGGGESSIEIVHLDDARTVHRFVESRLSIGWPRIMDDNCTALVPTDDGSIRAFDLKTGLMEWGLTGHSRKVKNVSLTSDGNLLASTSHDGTVRIWDLEMKNCISMLQATNPNDYLAAEIRWSPHGNLIATFLHAPKDDHASEVFARVWSSITGDALINIPLHGGIYDLAWSPDSKLLATAHKDGYVRRWNVSDGSIIEPALSQPEWATAVAFDPKGKRLATGGYQESAGTPAIRIWDVASGELTNELSLSGSFLFSYRIPFMTWTSRGDLLATTAEWPTVECFDSISLKTRWFYTVARGGAPRTIYALPNIWGSRVYVSGMFPETARIIDVESGQEIHQLGGYESDHWFGYWYLSGTSDGRYFIASSNGTDTVVFDGQSFNRRFRRLEHADGHALLVAQSLIHRGDSSAVRSSYVTCGKDVFSLDTFAPMLYDPKRFQAAAEGVSLRRVEVPTPPQIISSFPEERHVDVTGNEITVVIQARHAEGVIGFQLEENNIVLPLGSEDKIEVDKEGVSTLTWTIEKPGVKETHLRIRAVGRTGVLSKPRLMTLRWQ